MNEYEQMKAGGASAEVIAVVLKADGKSAIESMKILRDLYNLSLIEVKEIVVRRDSGLSLFDYQQQLFESWLEETEENEHFK